MAARRVTTAVTLVVLSVVLVAMAVYGFKAATQPLPSSGSEKETCSPVETEVKTELARKEVQVSVYNAGRRSGLAAATLEKLEAGGFRGGNSGNAPDDAKVRRAVVWTTEQNDPAAGLVALAFGPKTRVVVTETDLGPGVDVLVGDKFKGLDRKAPRKVKLPKPVENCVQVG